MNKAYIKFIYGDSYYLSQIELYDNLEQDFKNTLIQNINNSHSLLDVINNFFIEYPQLQLITECSKADKYYVISCNNCIFGELETLDHFNMKYPIISKLI